MHPDPEVRSGPPRLKSGRRHVTLLHVIHRLSKNERGRAFAGQNKLGLYLAEKTGRAKPYSERQIRRLLNDLRDDGAIEIERPDRTEQNLIRVAIGANELEAAIASAAREDASNRLGDGQVVRGRSRSSWADSRAVSGYSGPGALHACKQLINTHEPLASEHEAAADQDKPCHLRLDLGAHAGGAAPEILGDDNQTFSSPRNRKKLGADNQTFSAPRNRAQQSTAIRGGASEAVSDVECIQ